MDAGPMVVLVGVGVALLLTAVAGASGRGQDRALRRLAGRAGIEVPPALRGSLRRRVGARLVWGSVGALVGLVAAAAAVRGLGVDPTYWAGVAGTVAGWVVGVWAQVARHASGERRDDAVRVARSRSTGLADYVPALERWGVPVAALAPAAVLLGVTLLARPGAPVGPQASTVLVVLAAAAPLVALAVAAALCAAVLRSRQSAGSAASLVWDDVLRCQALRDVAGMPVGIAVLALFGVMASAVPDSPVKGLLGLAIMLLAVAVVLAMAVTEVAWRPERDVVRRLWPAVPQEVMVGAGR